MDHNGAMVALLQQLREAHQIDIRTFITLLLVVLVDLERRLNQLAGSKTLATSNHSLSAVKEDKKSFKLQTLQRGHPTRALSCKLASGHKWGESQHFAPAYKQH